MATGTDRRRRSRQLEYSSSQALMLDEDSRGRKGRKIAAIVGHFLGRDELGGVRVLDVGCSGGIIARQLRAAGADVIGVDIDLPGISRAHEEEGLAVLDGDSERLPVRSDSFDVVVCNHVYEHTVDPDRMLGELARVLRPSGIAFLGLGNRLGIIEPHYRLPFLSYLPRRLADAYLRNRRGIDHYHEQFRTRRGLRRMLVGWNVWDYTRTVLAEPALFDAEAEVPAVATHLPGFALTGALVLVPTYLWIGSKDPSAAPEGGPTRVPPTRVKIPAA